MFRFFRSGGLAVPGKVAENATAAAIHPLDLHLPIKLPPPGGENDKDKSALPDIKISYGNFRAREQAKFNLQVNPQLIT